MGDAMRYLIFATESDAQDRSSQEATALGCGQSPSDVSRYWWSWRSHPDGRSALEIQEGDEGTLTSAEIGALLDELPTDWLPD